MYKRTKEREENEYMKKEGKVDKIEDFTKLTHKKGISLIVLIVTIIVIIILAAVVILTIAKNNPVSSAKEATFKEDVTAIQDELSMYLSKKYTDDPNITFLCNFMKFP